MQALDETETEQIQAQLFTLRQEHRDLDAVLDEFATHPPADQLLLRRIKKWKLALKDRINHLEQLLTPDIPA